MLYPRWLETSKCFAKQPALFDGGSGEVWTFSELAARAAAAPRAEGPVFARSGSAEFFVSILRAWRDGQAVIPVERAGSEPVLHAAPPEGTLLVKHTPGAAGIPRGIFFDAAQIAADADRIVAAMRLTAQRPNLGVISLSHSYGFSNVVLPLLLHGVPVHLLPVPFPRAMVEVFQQHSSLVLPAVPSMWRAWHRAGILKDAPIHLALSAGAPLVLELEHAIFEHSGLKVRNFYGASECGGISYDSTDLPRDSAEDAGQPLPGVDISTSMEGRLLVTSGSVALGYDECRHHDPLENGGYLTHDLGHLDASGKVRLLGTIGGAINVAGRKISPTKVEAALMATGLLEGVQVKGIPSHDLERVQEISARVRLSAHVTLDQLKLAATTYLVNWELPRHWEIG
jgi:long-chain acyl-CoA synthetase